jgi:adenylate cyclase
MHLLEGLRGLCAGVSAEIPEGGLTVGKLAECGLQLDDPLVSRSHARLERAEGGARVTDLGSTNGTFVNDVQVQSSLLRHGDEVQIGGTVFRYRDRPAAVLDDPLPACPPDGLFSPTPTATVMRAPAPGSSPVAPSRTTAAHAPADTPIYRVSDRLSALARTRPGTVSVEESLERILGLVFDLLPVDRGCIVLLDEAGNPQPRAVRYREDTAERRDMPISRTLLRQAIDQDAAVLVSDAMADAALGQAASVLLQRIRCAAYAPICFADQVLGVICVDTRRPGGLAEADLELLNAFANEAALVTYQARLEEVIRQEERRRGLLQRFLAPTVAQQFLSAGQDLHRGGEEREITVLFADVRGFTPLAEHTPASELVALLNLLFERLCEPVMRHRGTLDKYIGDCIMAIFGAPGGETDHCLRAVSAAAEMQREMARVRSELAGKYGGLAVGIAINTGRAVVGLIGTDQKLDYTAIGDTVNVAARVEELAGPGQILVTEPVARQVHSRFQMQQASELQLRGRQQTTSLFSVTGVLSPLS